VSSSSTRILSVLILLVEARSSFEGFGLFQTIATIPTRGLEFKSEKGKSFSSELLDTAWFASQLNETTAASSRFADDSAFLGFQVGDIQRVCTVEQSVIAGGAKEFKVDCVSDAKVTNSTNGLIEDTRDRLVLTAPHPVLNVFRPTRDRLFLTAPHPVLNVFHLPIVDFFLKEKNDRLIVTIHCIDSAAVIINLSGDGGSGGGLRAFYYPVYELAPVLKEGRGHVGYGRGFNPTGSERN
jgi:hypothetical protein